MGLGIWSMHFLGMLALDLARPVNYRLDLVGLSMVAAVLGAGVSLWVITRPGARIPALFTGAGYMGAAIGTMHYSGMASMEVDAHMTWSAGLVALSVIVAYAASLFALGERLLAAPCRPASGRCGAASRPRASSGSASAACTTSRCTRSHFHATSATMTHAGLKTGAIATLLDRRVGGSCS